MSVSVSRTLVMPRLAAFMQSHPQVPLRCAMVNQIKDMYAAGLNLMFHSSGGAKAHATCRRSRPFSTA